MTLLLVEGSVVVVVDRCGCEELGRSEDATRHNLQGDTN
jgi:hypothetical protein